MNQHVIPLPDWASPAPAGLAETFLQQDRIALLHGMTASAEVYRTGQNSWSPAGWRQLSDEPLRIANSVRRNTADDTWWDDPVRHHSSWMILLTDGTRSLLVGALDADTPRAHADLDVVSAWTETGKSGLWVVLEGPESALLERYKELLKARWGVLDADPGTVWSSWYSYYENISQALFDEILPQLPALGFDTFQIDDGWEKTVGDWEPNAKFPAGMAAAAQHIKSLGLRPGLWLAPFIVLPGSEAFSKHRAMLLRDAQGELVPAGANWGSSYFTYDYTRDDAHELLAETIHKAVDEWGYSYLKLDFLQAAATPGAHHTPADREQVYRRAIETIRDAAGPSTYLLGSGALLMPSLGVFNAVRIGPDVAPMWTNYATDDPSDALAYNSLRNAVERLWMHGLIGIDPDAVFARSHRNLLSSEQNQWLRDAATLCGFRAVSDPPQWLTAEEAAALRDYLGPLPTCKKVTRYRYQIGDREVDFAPAINGVASPYAL